MKYAKFKLHNASSRKNSFNKSGDFEQQLQDNYGASDYDMMMIFGTSASEQAQYLRDNPQFNGIIEPMGEYVTSRLNRRY